MAIRPTTLARMEKARQRQDRRNEITLRRLAQQQQVKPMKRYDYAGPDEADLPDDE